MGFTYFTTQKHHNFTDKLEDMTRNWIRRKTKTCDMGTLPWNDPSDEARPHSPKFTRMLSLIAFETLNWVMIMGSSPTSSLLGSKKTSTTMYLFLNPTMIVLYLAYNTPNLSDQSNWIHKKNTIYLGTQKLSFGCENCNFLIEKIEYSKKYLKIYFSQNGKIINNKEKFTKLITKRSEILEGSDWRNDVVLHCFAGKPQPQP